MIKASSLAWKSTANEGGYTSTLPEEGYVLVFEQETPTCEIFIDGKNLRFEHGEKGPKWFDENQGALEEMLELFRKANIYYALRPSRDGNYVYVIVSASLDKTENWADDKNIDVMLDAKKAIKHV